MTWSHHVVTKKDLNVGLLTNRCDLIMVMLHKGVRYERCGIWSDAGTIFSQHTFVDSIRAALEKIGIDAAL